MTLGRTPVCSSLLVAWLALGAAASAFAQAPPVSELSDDAWLSDADEMDVNLGAPAADAQRVAELVALLGDPEYGKREQASAQLADLCPGAFGGLARAYEATEDFETRLRIEQIVRQAYLWHTLLKHKGFLGIAYSPQALARPGTGTIVMIERVEPGTAAADAGLQRADLIRSVDGEPLGDENGERALRDVIQAKGAGGKVRLEVLRRSQTIVVEVTLKARPIDQYNSPELLDELNSRMQTFALWWGRYFHLPQPQAERTPSTAVLELPE